MSVLGPLVHITRLVPRRRQEKDWVLEEQSGVSGRGIPGKSGDCALLG
jgi:hypothetical protein